MERYSRITNKNRREIVLLKARPCAWGKCTFCDYIHDNSVNMEEMVKLNKEVLKRVTGEFGVLEVIDSASCFELPEETLEDIRTVVREKKIKKIFFESHYMYRNRLDEIREFFGIPVVFKVGVESFDEEFREKVLNKHALFKSPEEVAAYFDSPCIMVGIKGQTKDMIRNDIATLKKYFKLGTVNVFTNNSTKIKKDPELAEWFIQEFKELENDPSIEVLYEKTDFGVGD